MKVKTILIDLLLCLVCNALLPLLSLSSTANTYTALALKPTNKNTNNNNTAPISKPPVTVNHPPVAKDGPNLSTGDKNIQK